MESNLFLQEICDQIRRKWLTPRAPPPPSHWEIWREQVLTAYAKACVILSDATPSTHLQMLPFLPTGIRCPTPWHVQDMGGVDAIYQRIKRGNLGVENQLGVWTPGFFLGLRLSRALRPYKGRSWAIWEWSRRELVADLADIPFPHKLEARPRVDAMRRLRRCPVSHLGCADPQDTSVIAGLFAGGTLKTVGGEEWIILPADEKVKALLDLWTIMYREAGLFRGEPRIQVSPFYAALFAHGMPTRSASRILNLRRAGLCPLLALVYFELCFARKGRRYLPFADALPFAICRRTLHRRGYKRRDLHRTAVLDLGIVRVDARLRQLMTRWFDEHSHPRRPVSLGREADPMTSRIQ